MSRPLPDLSGAARAGLYLFALSLVFWPITDLVLNVWPPQPGNVQWRYGFAGLLSSFLHTPMLGLLLALAVAWQDGQRTVLRVLGVLQILAAAVLLGVVGLFALDLLQVRGFRPPESLPAMFVGGAVSGGKYLVVAASLALLGMGTLRVAGRLPSSRGGRTPQDGVLARPLPRSSADSA